jgi:hypothetical protein
VALDEKLAEERRREGIRSAIALEKADAKS